VISGSPRPETRLERTVNLVSMGGSTELMVRQRLARWFVGLPLVGALSGCPGETTVHDDDDDDALPPIVACINEFMATNAMTLDDGSGDYPDWIDLHSLSDEDQSLQDHYVSDDLDERFKHRIEADVVLPARGFLLLWADGQPALGPDHLGFGLARDGEEVGLFGPSGEHIDSVVYGQQTTDFSAARIPDGGEDWEITYFPTPGWSNEE